MILQKGSLVTTTASTWLTLPPAAPVPAHPQLGGLVTSCRQSSTGHSRPSPWPTSSMSHHTKGSPLSSPTKTCPAILCHSPSQGTCSLCVPSPHLWAQLFPQASAPFPDAVPLFLAGYSRASFFCPSAKDKGLLTSAKVILVTSGSWAPGARPVHGQRK